MDANTISATTLAPTTRHRRRRASNGGMSARVVVTIFAPPRISALLHFLQLKCVMYDLKRLGAVFLGDDAADLDLGGGDVLDVDLRVGQRPEHALSDASVRAHAHADDTHLREVALIDRLGLAAELADKAVAHRLDVVQVAVLNGET